MTFTIRTATPDDIPDIAALVRAVVYETYADLIARNGEPPKGDPARWADAIIADNDGAAIGVGLARANFISDLWVASGHREGGVGPALLAALEEQIFAHHREARLRVVAANERARRFYTRQGWREVRTYPHERDGHLMVDFVKARL